MITIYEIKNGLDVYKDKEVQIGGWIRNIRAQKNFGFINLHDGTCLEQLQIVFDDSLKNFDKVSSLLVGSSISVKGKIVPTPERKQAYELQAKEIKIITNADPDFPIQAKRHTRDFLRSKPDLRIRTNLFQAVFRTRSVIAFAIHEFFNSKNFVYVNTPIITSNDGEGAGEMFNVVVNKNTKFEEDFFKKQVYLTVTGQLHGEAYAQGFRSIYTFGPTFRAENSNTTKHAAEFWMIEPEVAFADLNEIMDIAEGMFKYIVKYIFENAKDELEFLNKFVSEGLIEKLEKAVANDFARVTYTEAIEKLQKSGKVFEKEVEWGMDLDTEHERYLAEEIYNMPIFLTDYPKNIKAFYMRNNKDGKTVAATDLLVPGIGELVGGSQREERLDVLIDKMEKLGMDIEGYDWYLDLRRYGTVEHSGFGLRI